MKYIGIKYSQHHSAEYGPPNEALVVDEDTDLSFKSFAKLVATIFSASTHFAHNVYEDQKAFDAWVLEHEGSLRKWLFGTDELEETLSVQNMPYADDMIIPKVWNLHFGIGNRARNIGFCPEEGSKYDSMWIDLYDLADEVESNKNDLQLLSRQELIDKLAIAQL